MQSHVLTGARLNTYDTVCFMAGALLLRPGEPCLGKELYCMLPSGLSDFPAWSTLTSDAERRICEGPIGDRVSKFCPLGGEAKLELAEERWVLLTTRAGTDICEEKETDSGGVGVGGRMWIAQDWRQCAPKEGNLQHRRYASTAITHSWNP